MNLETAIKLATDAHAGQVDEAGEPYILHPLRVMLAMKTNDQRIVAVLHDMVGDSPWTCNDLSSQHGFKTEIVEAVAALTRFRGEYYFDFIRRLAPNPIARAVKIADLRDKLNPSREIPGDAQLRFRREKYRCALDMLLDI
jgi:hypothetical protein